MPHLNRFDRIVAILIKLQTRRVVTAAALAEDFGTSLRTIYRDIRSLENAGVPIGSEAGVGYFLGPGYHLPPVAFTAEEASALLVGDKFVQTHARGATSHAHDRALAKVRAVLKSRDKDDVQNLEESVAVFPNGPHRHPPTPDPWLEECQRALARGRVIEVAYRRRDGEETGRRRLEAIGLYHARSNWHLVAWCRLREDYRDFRLDRIASLAMLDETYGRGRHPTLADYVASRSDGDHLITVELGFSEEVAGWISEARYGWGFTAERRQGQEIRMQFLVGDLEPLSLWLLSFAGRVIVHEPDVLRARLAVHAAALLSAYGAPAEQDETRPSS